MQKLLSVLNLGIVIILSGCTLQLPLPADRPSQEYPAIKEEAPPIFEKQTDPVILASLQLTEQGKLLLEQGKVDEAITVFERAINLSPANGLNYYYLAEALIATGDLPQAREWNNMAKLYLSDDLEWKKKVDEQRERIDTKNSTPQ